MIILQVAGALVITAGITCVVVAVLFSAALAVERWAQHRRRSQR